MQYYENGLYQEEIKNIVKNISLGVLSGKSIVITGARGLIGSELIDSIMYANNHYELHCKIYAVVRNLAAAKKRFHKYKYSDYFSLLEANINSDEIMIQENIDYFIHGASNTHPLYYAAKPIETILTNTLGTNNTLKFAVDHNCEKYIYLSSVEIYGENKGDRERFTEDYCGYIDCNTLRAGYPESKRTGEALCQAYMKQYGAQCIIARIARCYGPGLLAEDSKALSQFLKNGVAGKDIILKSEGTQCFSYVYAADVASGIITLLDRGVNGEAYNIVGKNSDITLKELSELIADKADSKVIFEMPVTKEQEGYSKVTKAIMDGKKMGGLSWKSCYSIVDGIKRTIQILRG